MLRATHAHTRAQSAMRTLHNKCEHSTTKDKSRNKIVCIVSCPHLLSLSLSRHISLIHFFLLSVSHLRTMAPHFASDKAIRGNIEGRGNGRGWKDFHMSFIMLMDLRLLLNCFSFSLEYCVPITPQSSVAHTSIQSGNIENGKTKKKAGA